MPYLYTMNNTTTLENWLDARASVYEAQASRAEGWDDPDTAQELRQAANVLRAQIKDIQKSA